MSIIDEGGVIRCKYVRKNAPDRPKDEDLPRLLAEMRPKRAGSFSKEKLANSLEETKVTDIKAIHVVYAMWCPHCHPTTVEPMKKVAGNLGVPCFLYDIDDPEQLREADDLVKDYGDWAEDYLIPQVFVETRDGKVHHVLTGYSESVDLTKRAVNNLLKSPLFRRVAPHV